jgi:hypothetical protein
MADLPMPEVVSAAADAGWPACGVWFDPEVWTSSLEREIRRRVDESGIQILDVEPIIVGVEPDVTEPLIAAAAALGARFVLFTSRTGEWGDVVERFGRACDVARDADPDLVVVYEFLPAFPIGTLGQAIRIVEEAGRGNGAVLVDNLHLARSGAVPADLRAHHPHRFPYLQIADAPALEPIGHEAMLEEARHGRLWPGEGALPVEELLAAVPGVPLSFEVRSRAARSAFADAPSRASYAWSKVRHLA